MKSLKKFLIAVFLLSWFSAENSIAQNNSYSTANYDYYKTGIGLRLGGLTSGLSLRSFLNPNSALEGIVGFGRSSFQITGLYEKFQPVDNAEGLRWFYGGGGHLGFFRYGGRYYYWAYTDHGVVYVTEPGETATVVGLDFILGLDYKFRNAPFNVGLDVKPFVDFFDGVQGYWDGALSFRFAF